MTEPYRRTPSVLRPLLWVLLTIGMAGNMATTLLSDSMALHVGFGVLTAASGVALVADYLRNR